MIASAYPRRQRGRVLLLVFGTPLLFALYFWLFVSHVPPEQQQQQQQLEQPQPQQQQQPDWAAAAWAAAQRAVTAPAAPPPPAPVVLRTAAPPPAPTPVATVPRKGWADASGWIDEAWVSFFDNNRLTLAEVAIASVNEFSKRPIIAYCIDCEVPAAWVQKYKMLIPRRMDRAQGSVFFNKLKAITLSNVRRGCIVESDTLVNWKADDMFDTLVKYSNLTHPMMARHPNGHFFGHQTMPFGHAHLIWTENALPFVRRVLELCEKQHMYGDDENAMNSELWKSGAKHQACLFDPFFDYFVWGYMNQNNSSTPLKVIHPWEDRKEPTQPDGQRMTAFHYVHGEKEPAKAWTLLQKMIATKGNKVYIREGKWYDNKEDWLHEGGFKPSCVL